MPVSGLTASAATVLALVKVDFIKLPLNGYGYFANTSAGALNVCNVISACAGALSGIASARVSAATALHARFFIISPQIMGPLKRFETV